jgi:hypothetical protein
VKKNIVRILLKKIQNEDPFNITRIKDLLIPKPKCNYKSEFKDFSESIIGLFSQSNRKDAFKTLASFYLFLMNN